MIRRMMILLIALLLSAIVWWIGPLVAIGTYFPLSGIWIRGILVALLLIWGFWPFVALFVNWILRHARAPLPRRKKRAQRDRVTARFQDAMQTLRYIALARQKNGWKRVWLRLKRPYIDEKPWFLVMGPGACGKTSIIHESGERFLLAEQYGLPRTSDTGPTQDSNWWLTERAVYIDTSGEWMQLDGQGEESGQARETLFKLIRRYRRYPGVDGLILCLSADKLLNASLTEHKSLADAVRARILEVAAWFRTDIPVYLIINNLDRLLGGETFLSMLNDELLAKGLGISMTKGSKGENDFIGDEVLYQAFQARISFHILELLHDTPDPLSRRQLLGFNEMLGALKKPLFSLLEQLFPDTPVGYTGRLQQIWFGSTIALKPWGAFSQQIPADMRSESRPAGTIYSLPLTQAISERGVLHNAVAEPLHTRLLQYGRYALVLLLLIGSGMLLTSRYIWEFDYISYITARFEETKRMVRDIPVTEQAGDKLIAAYEQMGYVGPQLLDAQSPGVNPYFEHHLLNQAAMQTYHRHLFKIFWPAVEQYVSQTLSDDNATLDKDVYDTLKVYLMLGSPEHRLDTALSDWFLQRWEQFAPPGYTESDKRLFSYHLRQLFNAPPAAETVSRLDESLIRTARLKASATPIQIRVVHRLQDTPLPARIENISLADTAGPSVSLMLRRKSERTVSDLAIPAFFTRASYHDFVLPRLHAAAKDMIEEESWVLNDHRNDRNPIGTQAAVQKLADESRKFYLMEYADHWETFLGDIRARPINSLDDAAILARQLSDPSSPLANLIRFAARETSLTGTQQGDAGSWIDEQRNKLEHKKRTILGEISGERTRFRQTPEKAVEDRFERLRRLGYELLQTTGSNRDPLARHFEELYNQLTTLAASLRSGQVLSQNSAFNRIQADASRQPEPVRSVMMDLVAQGNTQTLQQSRENLSKSVSSLATGLCRNAIAGRYPFTRHAREEVGISDFSRLFGRNGAMQHFFDENLAPFVETNSDYNWQIRSDSNGILDAKALKSFEKAAQIRDTFFDGNDRLAFSMIIRPISLSSSILEAVLDIDGQTISYSHGSTQPTRMEWPGPRGGVYVRLTFNTADGKTETVSFDGPWALFRLYDASNPSAISSKTRELTMAMASINGIFKVELGATMNDYPLWSSALHQFSCPDTL